MRSQKPKAKKPKDYAKLSQKKKFIEAAKATEADESGEPFRRALKTILSKRPSRAGAS